VGLEEAVLEVEGVIEVRVWDLPERVEVGVRLSVSSGAAEVLARVAEVVDVREEGEDWSLGVLTDD
jgi:hypothetical protein